MIMQISHPEVAHLKRFFRGSYGTHGFTLVELIVVTAILGVLAAMGIPAYTIYVDKAKNAKAIGELSVIDKEIQSHYIDRNAFPTDLTVIGRSTLKDPWGQLYIYAPIPTLADSLKGSLAAALNPALDYDLYSSGKDIATSAPDYVEASCADDIVRAGGGTYFGLRERF